MAGATQGHHHITTEEWQRIQASPEFQQLVAEKRSFILPATVFFIVYYFALPVLVGYFPAADGDEGHRQESTSRTCSRSRSSSWRGR